MTDLQKKVIKIADQIKNIHNVVSLKEIADNSDLSYSQVWRAVSKLKKDNLWPYQTYHAKQIGNKNRHISNEQFMEKYKDLFSELSNIYAENSNIKIEDVAKKIHKSYNFTKYFIARAKKRNLWDYKSYKSISRVNSDSLWQKVYNLYKENPNIKASQVIQQTGIERCKNFLITTYLYRIRREYKIQEGLSNEHK